MRDYKNIFGTITAGNSEHIIDFGLIDERTEFTAHHTGAQHDSTVVFHSSADLTTALTGIKVQDSADGTTFTDLMTAPNVAVGAPNSKAGIVTAFKMPLNHRRYVRACATGGGSVTLSAWLEPGPDNR
jgi:hypothetical protein